MENLCLDMTQIKIDANDDFSLFTVSGESLNYLSYILWLRLLFNPYQLSVISTNW